MPSGSGCDAGDDVVHVTISSRSEMVLAGTFLKLAEMVL
jgi:hypothetical protein